MRILHINKYGWPKGGSDIYMLRACERQRDLPGVSVGIWAAMAPADAGFTTFDMELADFHATSGIRARAGAAATVLWSKSAQRNLERILDAFRPDVAHLHLYSHHLSASIIALLHKRGIPTVATAHDYKLICPSYLATRRGAECFACARRLSSRAIRDKCLHDDATWSALAVVEAALVRRTKLVPRVVVAPSRFVFDRLASSWLRGRSALELLMNPADPSGIEWSGDGGFILYVGRLSPEKGVAELIDVWSASKTPLVVAGDGPDRPRLERLAATRGSQVEFVGHVDADRLASLRRRCLAQVVPSRCPEVISLAALEAAVDGVPLVLANRGGMPELIEHGARGVVVHDDSLESWTSALSQVAVRPNHDHQARLTRLRQHVAWKSHVTELMRVYERAQVGSAADASRQTRINREGGLEEWT